MKKHKEFIPHIPGPVWVNFHPEGLHSMLVSSSGFVKISMVKAILYLMAYVKFGCFFFSMFFCLVIFIKFSTVRCPQNFIEWQ
jgi:hypothetical protein